MPKILRNADLSMAMIQADLIIAKYSIDEAGKKTRESKYIKAQGAYHLQQAAEKLIKIQLYASGVPLNNSKNYRHSLDALMIYAGTIGVTLKVPPYIRQNTKTITDWEAQGRYDLHAVVRINMLLHVYNEISQWYTDLYALGYR